MGESREIHRETVPIGMWFDTTCVRCGSTLILFFNGGELDLRWCCGLTYRLEHERIDFVVRDNG